MNKEKQEKSLQKLKDYIKDDEYNGPVYNSVEEYLNSSDEESEEEKAKKEEAEKEWTESLIEWYDIYKESNP
jgi:CO dehydrogenase/acetyl-CoA synthase beta subunit